MQEEIEQKSFNIMISTTKLSARTVLQVGQSVRLYHHHKDKSYNNEAIQLYLSIHLNHP